MSRLILVLGMHRSGTSLVARSLKCLGAELGPRAEWVGEDNKTGFYENLDVLEMDDLILRAMGVTWDDPEPWPVRLFMATGASAKFAAAIEKGMSIELAKYPVFAVKEPRLCRLLPFWRPILARLGCQVSVVHVIRHPLAVAASLLKRNGIPIERGLALWLEYVKRAREDCDPAWPSVTVAFDSMMVLPIATVTRTGLALGLPVGEVKIEEFADTFVDRTLWHEETPEDADLPAEAALLWELVRKDSVA